MKGLMKLKNGFVLLCVVFFMLCIKIMVYVNQLWATDAVHIHLHTLKLWVTQFHIFLAYCLHILQHILSLKYHS